MSWRHKAACQDVDGELFFPVGNGPLTKKQEARAKAVCNRCSVKHECLESAMGVGGEGIFGGTNASERSALRRRSRR